MKKMIKTLKCDEGNAVVEATLVVTICIFIIFIIIILGFVFYQENLLQSVVNKVANQVARTYSYERKDPVTGYISEDGLKDQGLVDSLYFFTDEVSGKKSRELSEANSLIKKYLDRNRIIMAHEAKLPEIKIENSHTAWFQKEVIVSVEEEYYIPFVRFLGVNNGTVKRSYIGKAECIDIIGAKSFHNMLKVVSKNLSSQDAVGSIRSVTGIITNFISAGSNINSLIKKLFGWEE